MGVTGVLTTAYLTVRATFKAAEEIHKENHKVHIHDLSMPPKDKVRLAWKFYIPPAISATLTVAAIITANRVGSRRAAALAAAFTVTERAFEEYRTKIVERLGEKKEESFRAEIAQERVTSRPPEDRSIIVTGNGSVLFMDGYSGRYFLSTVEEIRTAENDINHRVIHDNYASLTDFYELIGLPSTSVSDEVGWNLDKLLDIRLSGSLTPANNKPCIYMEFTVLPIRDFSRIR